MVLDSKNRTEIDIGFRLGGYDDTCTGTAWFSEIKLEMGNKDTSTEWKFGCFIFKNVNVNLNVNGNIKNYNYTMTSEDVQSAKDNMIRFKNSCEELSNNNMKVSYDIIEIDSPITELTYNEENEFYVNPVNVEKLINEYVEKSEYDHIFAVVRLGDLSKNSEIPVNDWIGLGGMDYYNIGFSNIRLSNNKNDYTYRYNVNVNTFPEEVYIHEFLHSLERTLMEYGYDIPELHDNGKYGYETDRLEGLKKWYKDYMTKNITAKDGTKVGLDKVVYSLKPIKNSNFKYFVEIDIDKQPENIIEEIKGVFDKLVKFFDKAKTLNKEELVNESNGI